MAREKDGERMTQKQTCKQADKKRTFEEFKDIMQEHLQSINGELSQAFNELAGGLNARQTADLDRAFIELKPALNDFAEKIKACYY